MYAGNVDFHTGDISAWISSQKVLRKTEDPFLSYVLLDLPNSKAHLANVAPVLHTDGILAVFNPSITQIAECVETIREQNLPYVLDQVIELGAASIRQWDVRTVRPRATQTSPTYSQNKTERDATVEETHTRKRRTQAQGAATKNEESRLLLKIRRWIAASTRPKAVGGPGAESADCRGRDGKRSKITASPN